MGLDMGTSSVGWAVTDEKYNLIKKHGKDMFQLNIEEQEYQLTLMTRINYINTLIKYMMI